MTWAQYPAAPPPPPVGLFTSVADGIVPASGGGTDNYLRADVSWHAPPGIMNAVAALNYPSGGTTTTSTAAVMAGQYALFTPTKTGKVIVMVWGVMGYPAGATVVAPYQGSAGGVYGTGTPPNAGDATTGTHFQAKTQISNSVVPGMTTPIAMTGFVTGLALGTQYWFDVEFNRGPTPASVTVNVDIVIFEVP